MNTLRKVLLVLLGIVLFTSLLGSAVSTSAKFTIYKPEKIKQWINDSSLYQHFVANAVEQGHAAVGSLSSSDDVTSLSDTAVEDAAKDAFSPKLVQESIDTILTSNYAWLEGKTDTPEFKINLTTAKQSFAQQVGGYTATYLAGLPVCTDAQLAQIQTFDPLSATCRPPSLDPKTAGKQVTTQIMNSDKLLDNTTLTAQNINPDPASQNEPYYEKFAELPRLYQLGQKLPYIFAATAILSLLAFVLLSQSKLRACMWAAIIFALAGIALITTRFTSEFAFKQFEDRAFNTVSKGELQESLTNFAHQVEHASTTIQMLFGIGFLVLAFVLFIVFRVLSKNNSPSEPDLPPVDSQPEPSQDQSAPLPSVRTNRPAAGVKKPGTPASKRPKKRPPRLVQ